MQVLLVLINLSTGTYLHISSFIECAAFVSNFRFKRLFIVRLVVRLRLRRAQHESKQEQARMKRISKLIQAKAFDNLGFSSSTLSNSSNNLILQYSGKPSHNVNFLPFPTTDSANRSSAGSNGLAPVDMTGHGCIWPVEEDEPYRSVVKRSAHSHTSDMSDGFVTDRTSNSVKANNISVSASAGNREKPLTRYYHAPSSHEAETATFSRLTGSEEGQHGQARSLSDAPLALVHQRQSGKSWQKNSQITRRRLHVENNGQHQKTFDNNQLLSISTNTNPHPSSSSKTKGNVPTATRESSI